MTNEAKDESMAEFALRMAEKADAAWKRGPHVARGLSPFLCVPSMPTNLDDLLSVPRPGGIVRAPAGGDRMALLQQYNDSRQAAMPPGLSSRQRNDERELAQISALLPPLEGVSLVGRLEALIEGKAKRIAELEAETKRLQGIRSLFLSFREGLDEGVDVTAWLTEHADEVATLREKAAKWDALQQQVADSKAATNGPFARPFKNKLVAVRWSSWNNGLLTEADQDRRSVWGAK